MVEEGRSMDEIYETMTKCANNIGTLGCSLSSCTLPGSVKVERIPEGQMEVGLGVHGEPGLYQSPIKPADEVSADVINLILDSESSTLKASMGKEWLLLINNMGGTTELEMSILAKGALETLEKRGNTVKRIVMGPLITSLGMAGFSFSLLSVENVALPDLI
jgi:dihydroxyacetone kinase